jgi:segregation and condensation protein B
MRTMRLSRAAVETLAIIAYRQPTTRSEIEQIRGVDAGGVLRTLLDRDLITLRGRAEGVGRPLLYGTTDFFLNHFGLKGLDELPRIEELAEIMKSEEMAEIEREAEGAYPRRAAPLDGAPEAAPVGAESSRGGESGERGGEAKRTPGEEPGEDGESGDVAAAGDL